MVKRKQPSAPSYPGEVQLQPAIHGSSDANATGPFVAYFASGYHPGLDDSLNFQVHRNVERPREQRLVVQKVSRWQSRPEQLLCRHNEVLLLGLSH